MNSPLEDLARPHDTISRRPPGVSYGSNPARPATALMSPLAKCRHGHRRERGTFTPPAPPRWLIELRGPHPPEPLLLLHKFTLGYTSPLPQPPERIPQLTSGRLWGCQRPSVRTDFEGGRQLPTSASVCRGAARSERALQVHEPRESPAAITTQPLVSAANTAVAIGSA
jgi:hypothetical protein